MNLKPNAKNNNDLSVGDVVIIANRFFTNNGFKEIDLGSARVLELTDNNRKAKIDLTFRAIMFQYASSGLMKFERDKETHTTYIWINTVYLEKKNRRKHAKEKQTAFHV